MDGLQVVKVVDAVPIRKVDLVSMSPVTLRVEGQDFRSVSSVRVNRQTLVSYMVLSDTVMDLELPDRLERAPVQSIDVYSDSLTCTEKSRFEFELGDRPRKVSGILKLLQRFVKVLLTTPGTNIFRPVEGGGLLQLTGMVIDPTVPGPFSSHVLSSVQRTKRQFVVGQAFQSLPLEEKLQDARVLGMHYDKQTTAFAVRILVSNMVGSQAAAKLGL